MRREHDETREDEESGERCYAAAAHGFIVRVSARARESSEKLRTPMTGAHVSHDHFATFLVERQ